MGMDVYGEQPQSKVGEYFRNNCWYWRPLWDYVCEVCTIDEKLHTAGHYNDGVLINNPTAILIADILDLELASGRTAQFEEKYTKSLEMQADEACYLCQGSGTRRDMVVVDGCNKCHGKGKVRPDSNSYPFSAENVQKFSAFCRASGGFRIS